VERFRARWALANATFYGGDPAEAMDQASALAAESAAAGLTVFEARCRCLIGLGVTWEDPVAGAAILDDAVALAREAGDGFALIDNQHCRANAQFLLGNLAAGEADMAAVRPLAEASGSGFHLGWDGGARALAAVVAADPAGAIGAGRAGQAVARRAGESNSDAMATQFLCFALADTGHPEEALREIAVAGELFARRPGWLTGTCLAAAEAYVLATAGRDEAAAPAAARSAERARQDGAPSFAGYGLLVTAAVRRRAGQFDRARAALSELDEMIDRGHGLFAAETGLERARLWRAMGEPDRAEETAHTALIAAFETGFRRVVLLALEELAYIAGASGAVNQAARILGACRAMRHVAGLVPSAEERRWIDGTTAAIVARLGDEAAEGALAEGERLCLDEAVGYVRRARGERGRPAAGWGSLTPTEHRVVDLVVGGLSNPQIADRLFMSRGTVKAHLAHVFAKLGVATRAELAAMAARHTS
jgi:DNA-binding CsgD family transcriptional regulator